MTLFGRIFRGPKKPTSNNERLIEMAKRHPCRLIDLMASFAELCARQLTEHESLAVLETAEVIRRSSPNSARRLIELAPTANLVVCDALELKVLHETISAQADRIRELEAEQQQVSTEEQPRIIPEGRSFYLLWSPTGTTPPRRIMMSVEEADQAGHRMAERCPAHSFYALKAVAHYQVDRPVKSDLVDEDDIPF